MRNADAAMYRAKERGGARYEIFDELMRARASKRIEIRSDLHRALRRDEFRLHYQPQVHLGSGRILGVEALLRWQHPRRGLLTAEDFIAVAEESGLIAPIGRWVLREACARLSLWGESHGDAAPTVAVNISPRELAEPDFVETVEQALVDSGATPWRLCIEITERGVIEDTEQSIEALTALKRLGVRLAIDDFGTGQSSLAYLNRFPVDVLKIDRFFLEHLGRGEDKPRVVAGVIGMAHTLDLTTVAEGVEREEQVPVLRELDCDMAQGFHFARALPAEEIGPLMAGPLG
jgi:EAL domain-containing protein (putative c-di-GMP-specific phosphodiesterase class I)